jgi:hypothetical protein
MQKAGFFDTSDSLPVKFSDDWRMFAWGNNFERQSHFLS